MKDSEGIPDDYAAAVWASDDGTTFRETWPFASNLPWWRTSGTGTTLALPQTTARFFRLVWKGPAKLRLRRVVWSSLPAIHYLDGKTGEAPCALLPEHPLPTEPGTAVPTDAIVDLTDQLNSEGVLNWKVPAGSWTLLRIGHRNITGRYARNAPASKEATGLECDPFNREAVAFHFDHYVGTILKDAETVGGKAMAGVLMDSWETHMPNGSPVFREAFRQRRGYDVFSYLPTFAGFIVGNRDATDRFLRDVRQTANELIAEHFYGEMAAQSRKHGLTLYAEVIAIEAGLHVDIPMTENGGEGPVDHGKFAASCAHLNDSAVVATEAFTGMANWNDCPVSLKQLGDRFFCGGINRIVFHTYAHNPDVTKVFPGPAFWKYGTPFSRGQTWWEMGQAWITYLSRCQFLLQYGHAAADALCFCGEDPASGKGFIPNKNIPALPQGFDWDLLPSEALANRLSTKDGRLITRGGTSYALLVLPDSDRMTPESAAKIRKLVKAGATVLGQKPLRSPSLSGYPTCDEKVRSIGDEVWGHCDGKTVTQHAFGKGRVFCGLTLKETFDAMGLLPDFSYTCVGAQANIRFIHRRSDDGTDIYFLSNQSPGPSDIVASFRVTGKQPELWDAVTGHIADVATFRQEGGKTQLPLHLENSGSIFVVFRNVIAADTARVAKSSVAVFREALAVKGPWTVVFTPGWGAPESMTFAALEDWSKRPEDGIKYYSGTAVYRTAVDWEGAAGGEGEVRLDLGDVAVIAEVKLNGTACGVAWTPPYRVDISQALKPGRNELEIRVANTWANRLIGDERLDAAARRTWTTYHSFTKDSQPTRSGLLGPVFILTAEKATISPGISQSPCSKR